MGTIRDFWEAYKTVLEIVQLTFFFFPEKTVGNTDRSKYKREDASSTYAISNLPNRIMDLLFYSKFVKESIFRKCSYLWFTRSFRKMKASPSWLWKVCKCVQNYLWGPMASPDWKYQSIMVSLDIVPLSKRNRWEISFSLSAENPGLKSQASKSYNLSEEEMRNTEHFSSTVLGGRREVTGRPAPSLLLQSLNRTECSYGNIFEKITFQILTVLILRDK